MKISILTIIALSLLFLASCKKKTQDTTYTIQGIISDINDDNSVGDVSVTLSKREVASGTFNSSYSKIAEQITTANGIYSFSTPYGSIESFKIDITQENYFSKSVTINPDDLSTEKNNLLNYSIQSKGYINFNIVNSIPFDEFDEITINSNNPNCPNCVTFASINLTGIDIDTNLIGIVEANKYYKLQYSTTKDGITNFTTDSVFCNIGDTTFQTISF